MGVLVAGLGTMLAFVFLPAVFRGSSYVLLVELVLWPSSIATWLTVIVVFAWKRKWPIAVAALAFPVSVGTAAAFEVSPYPAAFSAVRWVEFAAGRSSYDAIVASHSGHPRLVRVSYRDTSRWCCSTQTFEEIWFDESDQLGSKDASVRDQVFWRMHPSVLGHTGYAVRSPGGHYYFVEFWY
jgi:hypothetical protein